MVAVIAVGMIVYPAGAVIDQVSRNDQDHAGYQQPELVGMKNLFQHQQGKTQRKNKKRQEAVMVFPVSMIKRIGSHYKSQHDHPHFKTGIINNIHPEKGQAAQE